MNKKYYYIIIVIVIVIAAIILVNLFDFNTIFKKYFNQKEAEEINGSLDNKESDQEEGEQGKSEEEKQEQKINNLKSQLKINARVFVEKYGSYSSYNKESNYNELNSLVTPSLFNQLSNEAENVQEGLKNIETVTASITIKEFDINDRVVCETEIRQNIEKEEGKEVFYKTAQVIFKKINSEWKINNFKIN